MIEGFDESGAPLHYSNVKATSYLVSSDQLNVTNSSPNIRRRRQQADMQAMRLLAMGRLWHTRQIQQQRRAAYVDDVHLGWWVAGDVIDNSDLPTDASASYGGHVIGNVSTNIGSNGWHTYVATGDMDMNWDFNSRSGDLTISKFDQSITPGGLTFTRRNERSRRACHRQDKFGGPLTLANDNLPNNLSELTA